MPLLIKGDYVLLSKWCRAEPTLFFYNVGRKCNVVITADAESLDSDMETPAASQGRMKSLRLSF